MSISGKNRWKLDFPVNTRLQSKDVTCSNITAKYLLHAMRKLDNVDFRSFSDSLENFDFTLLRHRNGFDFT